MLKIFTFMGTGRKPGKLLLGLREVMGCHHSFVMFLFYDTFRKDIYFEPKFFEDYNSWPANEVIKTVNLRNFSDFSQTKLVTIIEIHQNDITENFKLFRKYIVKL